VSRGYPEDEVLKNEDSEWDWALFVDVALMSLTMEGLSSLVLVFEGDKGGM
jgi:hypothetical protein